MDGIIVINKAKGDTSFKTTAAVRRILNVKKAGHCGTLDPLATGVLPVMTGNSVKCSEYLIEHDKIYRAKILFGFTSDTEDSTGDMKRNERSIMPDLKSLTEVLPLFKGKIKQIPPMYSAIKKDGKKLYELARKGIETERQAREVTVYDIDAECTGDDFYLNIICSKGTYIRTLCSDIGKKLGCGAVMDELCRTAVGKCENVDGKTIFKNYFSLHESVTIDELKKYNENEIKRILISPEKIYDRLDSVSLSPFFERLFRNGVKIGADELNIMPFNEGDLYKVYGKDGFFAIGVGIKDNGKSALKVKNFF